MIEFDEDLAVRLMEESVTELGEENTYDNPYAVDECQYVHCDPATQEYAPGCLMGRMLYKAGVSLGDLRFFDKNGESGTDVREVLVQLAIDGLLEPVNTGLSEALECAQRRQDNHTSFGEVLRIFKEDLGR